MSIRAVAWDIDGTLIDSEPLHLRALLATCANHGVDISDLADDTFIGVNLHGVWQKLKMRYPPSLTMPVWVDELNEYYVAHADTLIPIAQAKYVATELSRLGIKQVAVSNSNRAVVDTNLQAVGVEAFMEFSLSLDDVSNGKPSPVPYEMAIKRLGLPASEIIAVEDSLSGIQSAKSAELVVLEFSQENLEFTMADRTIRCLTEILKFISEPFDLYNH